jgi:hypothetical protein
MMRSADEIRERKLGELQTMIRSSGMWAGDGRSMQTIAQSALEDLAFIDGRSIDYPALCGGLQFYGKLGVVGAFDAVFGAECSYVAEVASVFAQLGVALGYIEPDRRLVELEWRSLTSRARDTFEDADVRLSEVLSQLGEPSLVVDKRVLCYAGQSARDWIAFDCWEPPITRYRVADEGWRGGVHSEWVDDPLLRDVRVPADTFADSLVLTTYGKVLRWGPGWWLDHAAKTDAPEGVGDQLREIRSDDPSQSLGPRRP